MKKQLALALFLAAQPAHSLEQCNDPFLEPNEFVVADTLYNFCMAEKTRSSLFNYMVREANNITRSTSQSVDLLEEMAYQMDCPAILKRCR